MSDQYANKPPRQAARAARSKDNFVYRFTCTADETVLFEVGHPAKNAAPQGMHPAELQIRTEQIALNHFTALLNRHLETIQQATPDDTPEAPHGDQ